jgi:hypothetical protein
LEIHHFGADASYEGTDYENITYGSKLSILMTVKDHLKTRSHGSSHEAKKYRSQLNNALKIHGSAEMFRMEINAFFEDGILIRYAYAIIQMLNRGKNLQFYKPGSESIVSFFTEQEYRDLVDLVLELFTKSFQIAFILVIGNEKEVVQSLHEDAILELTEVDEFLERLNLPSLVNQSFDWFPEYIEVVWDAPENYIPSAKKPVKKTKSKKRVD